jgi:amino acid transporter
MTDSPKLKREMSSFGGLLITVSCLSPSIGVFIAGNDVLHQVGSGAFLCFLAAIVLGIAMSAVYAELGSAFPHTGGEYTITAATLSPAVGFGILANTLSGYCIALATSGLGVVDYLHPLMPWIPRVPGAAAIVTIVTLIAVLSVKTNALITGLFLGVEIVTLLATAVLGFTHAHSSAAPLLFHPMVSADAKHLHPVAIIALGVAASGGVYAFNGYGSVVLLGEEIRGARAKMGPVVYGALAVAAVTEMLPLTGIIFGAPNFAALTASASPMPDFFAAIGGPVLSKVLSLAVALAIFNTMIAVALLGARQIYASARDKAWSPFVNRSLDRIHPRWHSPWIATLLLGAVALAIVPVPTHLLLIILGNGNVALYAALSLAVIVGRRTGTTALSQSFAKLHPLAPVFSLLCLAGIIWANWLDPDTGRPGLFATAIIFCGGALYYWAVLRRRPGWALRGPVDE